MGLRILYYPFPAGAGENSDRKIYINQQFPVPVWKQIAFLLGFLLSTLRWRAGENVQKDKEKCRFWKKSLMVSPDS
tara:strand:- start:1067 stop:1294 length:228 start_codon:yes stop_codon:yes gene_type:complete